MASYHGNQTFELYPRSGRPSLRLANSQIRLAKGQTIPINSLFANGPQSRTSIGNNHSQLRSNLHFNQQFKRSVGDSIKHLARRVFELTEPSSLDDKCFL